MRTVKKLKRFEAPKRILGESSIKYEQRLAREKFNWKARHSEVGKRISKMTIQEKEELLRRIEEIRTAIAKRA